MEGRPHAAKHAPRWTRPFAKLELRPTPTDRVAEACVDREPGSEGISYRLESGADGSVHIDRALEYSRDPGYLGDVLIHTLTVEAAKRVDASGLSRRELARRVGGLGHPVS